MLKVDILNDAKKAEQEASNFVEQTKQLILEEGTKETAVLTAAGLNKQNVEAVRLRDEKAMRKELKMKSNCTAVLNIDEIRKLCMKYRLRFLKSQYYAGSIDALTGRKINKFLEDIGDPSPEYSARERLYILAPAEAFHLEIGKPIADPVLFYRHDSGLYAVVHKWGNDFTFMRRTLGFLTENSLRWRWFMFLTLASLAATSYFILDWFGLGVGYTASIPSVIGIFALVRTFIANEGNHEARYTFSDHVWNNNDKTDRSLLWL